MSRQNHRTQKEHYAQIPVNKIDPSPFGIRKNKESHSLGKSIKKFGVIAPIRVRPKRDRFEVIYGDRRLEQAKKQGLKQIACIVESTNDRDALLKHITENLARRDFTAMEEAEAYQRLKKLGFETQTIAKLVGKASGTVSNRLSLLHLPEKIQGYVQSGALKVQLGLLISHQIPSKFQEHVADTIVENKYEYFQALSYVESLTERFKLEAYHQALKDEAKPESADAPAGTPDGTATEEKPEPDPEWVAEKHRQVEAKLAGAFAIDHINLGFLRIWKLAQSIEPKLRNYERLLCDREKVVEALRQDLQQLEHQRLVNAVKVAAPSS